MAAADDRVLESRRRGVRGAAQAAWDSVHLKVVYVDAAMLILLQWLNENK